MNARELALRVLQQRYGAQPAHSCASFGLAEFQLEAHDRLLAAIGRYRGALLADSVGLGKTYVAAAVAGTLEAAGRTLAVVPTSLLRHWRRALSGSAGAVLISHARLSRSGAPADPGEGLLIVDEAHAFRNPRTRRYAALARLAETRPVLLLTATPVNNSVWDLYWLLRLFAHDRTFASIGIGHLGSCFEQAHRSGRSGRIPAVLAAVVVRRSRALVLDRQGQVAAGGHVLAFPERAPPVPVRYSLPPPLVELLAGGVMEELELGPWRDFAPAGAVCLLRLLLLKRLESSVAALRASLLRLHHALRAFAEALENGLLLAPGRRGGEARTDQLELVALVLRPLPRGLDRDALACSAARDLQRLAQLLALLDIPAPADPKLASLSGLLRRLDAAPVVLFTEFRETADYLWRALRHRVPTALIHGSGAWLGTASASRRAVIDRFAPVANGAPVPNLRERVRLLIATDVLAEGLNLQDAADVVSYDLPWNPVRLVQRLGRIDRLGSPHSLVRSWYFVPQHELEKLLGLLRRIRVKLHAIRATVGEDAPVLAVPAPTTIRRLASGDDGPLLSAERLREGMLDIEERLRTAFRRARVPADDGLAALRHGLGSQPAGSSPKPAASLPEPAVPAFAPEPTPAVAALTGPAGLSSPGRCDQPLALVILQHGTAQRAVLVGKRRCFEDDVVAGEILLHALDSSPDTLPGLLEWRRRATAAVRRAQGWLAREAAEPLAEPALAARLKQRVLHALQELPGGATEEQCRRAELVLRQLQGALPAAVELSLRRLAAHRSDRAAEAGAVGRAPSLANLLDEIEARLGNGQAASHALAEPGSSRGVGAAPEPSTGGLTASVIGVFVLSSGG